MHNRFDRQRLQRTVRKVRGEALQNLRFEDAFDDTLAMMALLIDMTASFTSPSEYERVLNHCGSLPPFHQLDGRKAKNQRRRP